MYRELLESHAAENPGLKARGPATMQQIREAEARVGHAFPEELIAVLLELNGDGWLFFSAEKIAETAALIREHLSECYEDIARHIFFAGNGCGDYYCYNVSKAGAVETDKIYLWDHELNESRPVAKDMCELIRRYFKNEI